MKYQLSILSLILFAVINNLAQSQSQGLKLNEVRIGLDKQTVLPGLRENYHVTEIPEGSNSYILTSKNKDKDTKGQINFSRGIVSSVSENIGGPYSDVGTINIVRDFYRLLSPYGKKDANGRGWAAVEVRFDAYTMAGFGDIVNISFEVEPGRQIHLGVIVPDDQSTGAPSASLSVFRNEQ